MNHCLLEVEVIEAPQLRYTQDNQTPVAEMSVQFEGLRPDDPSGQIKVVGWGNLAQDLQNRVQVGQRLMLEGRLRISTITRADGLKEKRAEFTLSRLHPLAEGPSPAGDTRPAPLPPAGGQPRSVPRPVPARAAVAGSTTAAAAIPATPAPEVPTWNTSPLVPELSDDDDIPF
ncbi:single-stranded DNA-binding protein [Synechococcus sp. CS-602]|uniref:single-stranded DNA-binding protein n=1 Tax=Synechococcaceae TaxID=1890426 RepID=UPI0008FF240E|nr:MULTISPECIES: single-stranded DNA-binding protein [Synechococcaceae]MCT4365767.1 single-stranded DNA-binding protein [Candidatus Regnicoccus frigidus MAG-AL1]APD49631.1 single-stranded DNA-binding protein [Synechococcus sp. SynAce01]MCT0201913.1 single-stranded DNA-binding protein [Synechococcus sp. CS-603]MCT0205531.1 single-stranded DNA-binding protein [Synechococcus sp. CS-602]MCT0246932.1 single-stranded DNA-binding protein [Synechococcus sp. CS-601]